MSEDNFSSFNVSTDDKFKNRANSIFGSLDSLEKKHQENIIQFEDSIDGEDNRHNNQRDDSKSCNKSHSSRDTSFNKLNHQNNKRRFPRRVPDHVLNPSSYKKYSLDNDGSRQIARGRSAEQVNQKIALDFINDLKNRKQIDHDSFKDESPQSSDSIKDDKPLQTKVTFQKPLSKHDSSESTKRPIFGSSHGGKAKVMQTYEIGQKRNKKEKIVNNLNTSNVQNEISLDCETDEHLNDKLSSNNDIAEKMKSSLEEFTEESSEDKIEKEEKIFVMRKKKKMMIRKRTEESVDDEV